MRERAVETVERNRGMNPVQALFRFVRDSVRYNNYEFSLHALVPDLGPVDRRLFSLLARAGRLSQELAQKLSAAAGFRNVLVHGYAEVDSRVTRDVLENHLGDLLAFAAALRVQRP